jgi:hypothetical protein
MECAQCRLLQSRIRDLESELATYKNPAIKNLLTQITDNIFNNPAVSPGDIKTVDYNELELLASFQPNQDGWSKFEEAFSKWACEFPIKAIAFIVCFNSQVKGVSVGVRALLVSLRACKDQRASPVLERCIYEVFKVKCALLTDEEVVRGRAVLAEYVEAEAFSDGDCSRQKEELDQISDLINAGGKEFCEARAYDLIRRVIWPLLPVEEGSLQDRIFCCLTGLVKRVSEEHIKNEDLKRVINI